MMYYVANRDLILGTGVMLKKGQRVGADVDDYLKGRYTKLGMMTKVYDTVDDKDIPASQIEVDIDVVEAYKNKEGGIKKLATRFGLTEYNVTKMLKKLGLV